MTLKYPANTKIINFFIFIFTAMLTTSPDHGGAIGFILLIIGVVVVVREKFFHINDETKLLIGMVSFLFLFFLIGVFWQPEGLENANYGKNINNPLQWVLLVPLLYLFSNMKISWRVLSWGIFVAGVGGAGIAIYQAYFLMQMRPGGFTNPIPFGQVMVVLSLFGLALIPYTIKIKEFLYSIVLFLSSISALYAVILSSTRGALIAYLIIIPIWLIFLYKSKQIKIKNFFKGQIYIFFLILLGMSWLVIQTSHFKYTANRTLSEIEKLDKGNYESSMGTRLMLWQIAWQSIQEYPFGVGTKNYNNIKEKLVLEKKVSFNPKELVLISTLTHAHNQYLNMLAENGWHTLLVFLGLKLFLLAFFIKNMTNKNEQVQVYATIGFFITASYMVFELTQSVFSHHITTMFYIFFTYLSYAQVQFFKKHSSSL